MSSVLRRAYPPPVDPEAGLSSLKNNHFTEMCCGTEAGSYLRLIDSCITQLKAQRPLGPVTRVKKKKKSRPQCSSRSAPAPASITNLRICILGDV